MNAPRPWQYPSPTDPGVVPSPWERPDPLSRRWHMVGDTIAAQNWCNAGQTGFEVPVGRVGILHYVSVSMVVDSNQAFTDQLHPLKGLDGRLTIRVNGRSCFEQIVDEPFIVHIYTPFSTTGSGIVSAYVEARSLGPVCIGDGQRVDWELTSCAWWDAGAKGNMVGVIETFEPIPLHRWIESQSMIQARRDFLAKKIGAEYGMSR